MSPPTSWVYNPGVPSDNPHKYKQGGFHPLTLHEHLKDGCYEIWHRLGTGGFATVWLARDTQLHHNVSIKILAADKSDEASCRELRILRHLAELNTHTNHPGKKYLPTLKDHFYIHGPNGRHLALVTDVVGPTVSRVQERSNVNCLPRELAFMASKQVLLAVDYLHECGIAHGDIHTGNILFRYPGLDTLDDRQILVVLGAPWTELVTRVDGAPCPQNVPAYVVEPTYYNNLRPFPDFSDIQLIDFGGAFFLNEAPSTLTTPVCFYPPELVFQHALGKAVDIWGLANTIYEFAAGGPIFFVWEADELPQEFDTVIGGVPPGWILEAIEKGLFTKEQIHKDEEDLQKCPTLDQYIRDALASAAATRAIRDKRATARAIRDKLATEDGESLQECPTLDEGIRDAPTTPVVYRDMLSGKDVDALVKCLGRMLVVDPAKRATSRELLTEEEWFSALSPSP